MDPSGQPLRTRDILRNKQVKGVDMTQSLATQKGNESPVRFVTPKPHHPDL